jgi:hypothetical protein
MCHPPVCAGRHLCFRKSLRHSTWHLQGVVKRIDSREVSWIAIVEEVYRFDQF